MILISRFELAIMQKMSVRIQQELPVKLQELPVKLLELPVELQELSVELQELSVEMQELTVEFLELVVSIGTRSVTWILRRGTIVLLCAGCVVCDHRKSAAGQGGTGTRELGTDQIEFQEKRKSREAACQLIVVVSRQRFVQDISAGGAGIIEGRVSDRQNKGNSTQGNRTQGNSTQANRL